MEKQAIIKEGVTPIIPDNYQDEEGLEKRGEDSLDNDITKRLSEKVKEVITKKDVGKLEDILNISETK